MNSIGLVNGLHFRNLRGDVFGGLTAAIVALPLALAFGVSSGAGAITGLYGAIWWYPVSDFWSYWSNDGGHGDGFHGFD